MISTLTPIFVGDFAWRCEGISLAGDPEAAESISMLDLMFDDGVRECLGRFRTQYPLATPRALASLWMNAYCMKLLPTAVVANLLLDYELPLDPDGVRVVIAEDGTVFQLWLPGEGRCVTFHDPFARFDTLILRHLSPLIDAISAQGMVSANVLWGRVLSSLEWLSEVARAHPLHSSDRGINDLRTFLSASVLQNGQRNPLFRKSTTNDQDRPQRKQACCFSHELGPEMARCYNCPVEQKKRRAACLIAEA